jgi:hypothetical protein
MKQSVWIVEGGCSTDNNVVAVFTSERKAKNYVKRESADRLNRGMTYFIEEWEVK